MTSSSSRPRSTACWSLARSAFELSELQEFSAICRPRCGASFGGLGIEVTMENGLVKVVSPIDDNARRGAAGIKPKTTTHRADRR